MFLKIWFNLHRTDVIRINCTGNSGYLSKLVSAAAEFVVHCFHCPALCFLARFVCRKKNGTDAETHCRSQAGKPWCTLSEQSNWWVWIGSRHCI